jgi:hypothetical protein
VTGFLEKNKDRSCVSRPDSMYDKNNKGSVNSEVETEDHKGIRQQNYVIVFDLFQTLEVGSN